MERLKTYFSNLYFVHIIRISKWKAKSLFYIETIGECLFSTQRNSSNAWKRSNNDVCNHTFNMLTHFSKELMRLKSSAIIIHILRYDQNFYVGSVCVRET